MIKTVVDLINALNKFDPDMPVCIRRGEGDGYFSDWTLHTPSEFFPGGKVCLSAFESFNNNAEELKHDPHRT